MNIIVRIAIIDGPVGISKIIEENIPIKTEAIAIKPDPKAILVGEFVICLEAAAGIISIDVISSIPTTFTQVATKITNNIKKIELTIDVLIPSDFAIFSSIVIRTSFSQII